MVLKFSFRGVYQPYVARLYQGVVDLTSKYAALANSYVQSNMPHTYKAGKSLYSAFVNHSSPGQIIDTVLETNPLGIYHEARRTTKGFQDAHNKFKSEWDSFYNKPSVDQALDVYKKGRSYISELPDPTKFESRYGRAKKMYDDVHDYLFSAPGEGMAPGLQLAPSAQATLSEVPHASPGNIRVQ